jgi:hypothetical protein
MRASKQSKQKRATNERSCPAATVSPQKGQEVLAFSGAVVGVMVASLLPAMENADANVDFFELMDRGLAYLEAGLPL